MAGQLTVCALNLGMIFLRCGGSSRGVVVGDGDDATRLRNSEELHTPIVNLCILRCLSAIWTMYNYFRSSNLRGHGGGSDDVLV